MLWWHTICLGIKDLRLYEVGLSGRKLHLAHFYLKKKKGVVGSPQCGGALRGLYLAKL